MTFQPQDSNALQKYTENRAYWLTVTNQRWLGIRLDFLGAILTFCVAILAVAARFSLSPSQIGVALSYILLVQQVSSNNPQRSIARSDSYPLTELWLDGSPKRRGGERHERRRKNTFLRPIRGAGGSL
ncbi:hypothetical protein ACGC1H_006665 [Rhizoctonia solani]